MADNIKITKVTEAQKKKRIKIQEEIYKLMDQLELSEEEIKKGVKSFNRQDWERKFSTMTDLEFHQMMEKMQKNRDYCFSYTAGSLTAKNKMSINKLHKIADMHNIKLNEYVIFPHKNKKNPNNPMVSKTPLPILLVSVKRLQQMLSKKNNVSSDTSTHNPITGQVTGDSKAARLSNNQTYALIASGQTNVVREMLTVRADDDVARKEMLREIAETGKANLSKYNLRTANMQSVNTMEVFLKAAGLKSNILAGRGKKVVKTNNLAQEDLTLYSNHLRMDDIWKDLIKYKFIVVPDTVYYGIDEKDINYKGLETVLRAYRPTKIYYHTLDIEGEITIQEVRKKLEDGIITTKSIPYVVGYAYANLFASSLASFNYTHVSKDLPENDNTRLLLESKEAIRLLEQLRVTASADERIAIIVKSDLLKMDSKEAIFTDYYKNETDIKLFAISSLEKFSLSSLGELIINQIQKDTNDSKIWFTVSLHNNKGQYEVIAAFTIDYNKNILEKEFYKEGFEKDFGEEIYEFIQNYNFPDPELISEYTNKSNNPLKPRTII